MRYWFGLVCGDDDDDYARESAKSVSQERVGGTRGTDDDGRVEQPAHRITV